MVQLLHGKVVAVTGSSSGIGRSIAIECFRNGASLVLHHIGDEQSKKDIESLRGELDVISGGAVGPSDVVDVGFDITDPEAGTRIVEAAISAFGEINEVVNNAGISQFEDFLNVSKRQLDRHMNINFGGPFAITQAVVEQMITQGKGGAVVSIASITATMGSSQLVHYAPTKGALLSMSVSCAVAFGKYGIRFNTVSPGTIETAINKEDLAGEKRSIMESRVPLGRLGIPEDIGKPVVFLVSDMAQYISGQNLIVDCASSVNYQ